MLINFSIIIFDPWIMSIGMRSKKFLTRVTFKKNIVHIVDFLDYLQIQSIDNGDPKDEIDDD